MDKFAEEKLEEFKQLHQNQLEQYGVDNLTVEEAYLRVLGTCSGYINGLGFGPKPPKVRKGGEFHEENVHFSQQMAEQYDKLEKPSMTREHQLNEKIQELKRDKVAMSEEMEKMKDVEEREQRMKEMEERMRSDIQEMVKQQLLAITSGQLNLQK